MKNGKLLAAFMLASAFLLGGPLSDSRAQGTAFTYQGRLNDGANPASGSYDMQFTVYDSTNQPGTVVAGPLTNAATAVSNGLFTVTLDFGNVFPGADRFLEIAVRTNGVGAFTVLAPRQQIAPTPYAVVAGDVSGGNVARLNVPNTSLPATGHPIITSGFITGAVVDNGGLGYTTPPTVIVSDSTGTGASISAVVSNGVVVGLHPDVAGNNYSSGATLTIGVPPPNNYQVFVTSNFFPNVNVFSNAANVFVGDGSGLSGVAVLAKPNTFTSSNTFLGPVGIGTATPSRMLEVQSVSDAEIGIRSADTNGHLWTLQSSRVTGSTNLDASFQIVDRTAVKSRFYIGTNGYVGIGTTSPGAPIEVHTLPGTNATLIVSSGGSWPLALDQSPISVGTISNGGAARITILPTGEVGIGKTPATALDVNGTVTAASFSGSDVSVSGTVSATTFSGSGTGLSGVALLNGGNAFLGNQLVNGGGRVGIGTATPNAALHVNGSVVVQGLVSPSAAAATNLLNIGSGAVADGFRNGISFFEAGGNTAMSFGYDGTGNSVQNALRIYNSVDAPLFTFQIDGSLGIGTTNPTRRVEVQKAGDVEIGLKSTDANGHLWTVQSTGTSTGTNADASFQISDRTLGRTRMMIGTNGFVGIGTTNPAGVLDVLSTNYPILGRFEFPGRGIIQISSGQIDFIDPSNAFADAQIIYGGPVNPFGFDIQTEGGETFMDEGGKLSINADAFFSRARVPSSRAALQVSDSGDTEIGIVSGDTGGHYWTLQSSGITGGSASLDGSFQIIDRNGDHSRFIIRTNGNVGIGTTAPAALFQVGSATCNGTIWNNGSDRNLKENFACIDPQAILEKVVALPVSEWNFKQQAASRHIGPMAQDFYAAFNVGDDDRHISTVDEGGVALAAIQGLNRKMEARTETAEGRFQNLEAENAALKQQNEALEKRLEAIERKLARQERLSDVYLP